MPVLVAFFSQTSFQIETTLHRRWVTLDVPKNDLNSDSTQPSLMRSQWLLLLSGYKNPIPVRAIYITHRETADVLHIDATEVLRHYEVRPDRQGSAFFYLSSHRHSTEICTVFAPDFLTDRCRTQDIVSLASYHISQMSASKLSTLISYASHNCSGHVGGTNQIVLLVFCGCFVQQYICNPYTMRCIKW